MHIFAFAKVWLFTKTGTFVSNFLYMQEPVTLLEYSMIAVTEGIDAIATTRVVIRGENQHAPTHALTDEPFQRTFRYSSTS